MAAGTIEKAVPGDDGDIRRGIAEAELYAHGIDVFSAGMPRLETFEGNLHRRREYLKNTAEHLGESAIGETPGL